MSAGNETRAYVDTANTAHLPHTTTPSKFHSYVSPPKKQQKQVTKKHERTYRDGIPQKQPNKVGVIPQYPYGLSSLYLLPFFQPHTHTHTHIHTPIPGMPHQPYPQPIAIAALHNATPHTTTYPPHACSNTHSRLHTCTIYPTFYTTIHTYNDTYTLPPATTPFHFANSSSYRTHFQKITLLYQSTFKQTPNHLHHNLTSCRPM